VLCVLIHVTFLILLLNHEFLSADEYSRFESYVLEYYIRSIEYTINFDKLENCLLHWIPCDEILYLVLVLLRFNYFYF